MKNSNTNVNDTYKPACTDESIGRYIACIIIIAFIIMAFCFGNIEAHPWVGVRCVFSEGKTVSAAACAHS